MQSSGRSNYESQMVSVHCLDVGIRIVLVVRRRSNSPTNFYITVDGETAKVLIKVDDTQHHR